MNMCFNLLKYFFSMYLFCKCNINFKFVFVIHVLCCGMIVSNPDIYHNEDVMNVNHIPKIYFE